MLRLNTHDVIMVHVLEDSCVVSKDIVTFTLHALLRIVSSISYIQCIEIIA